jgi:hypothetical protein
VTSVHLDPQCAHRLRAPVAVPWLNADVGAAICGRVHLSPRPEQVRLLFVGDQFAVLDLDAEERNTAPAQSSLIEFHSERVLPGSAAVTMADLRGSLAAGAAASPARFRLVVITVGAAGVDFAGVGFGSGSARIVSGVTRFRSRMVTIRRPSSGVAGFFFGGGRL